MKSFLTVRCTVSVAMATLAAVFGSLLGCGSGATTSAPVSAAAASLSAASLSFGSQQTGTTSSAQVVTLTNTGGAPLTFAGLSITGANAAEFAETTTCGASLAASATCTVSVTFSPTAAGSASASLSIADNAAGSPQAVALSGTGVAPVLSLSPSTPLSFGSQTVGTTSPSLTATLTNTGTLTAAISGISMVGLNASEFAQTSTCAATLLGGASCAISVTFAPGTAGSASATLSVADNATGSPQTVALTGTGIPAVPVLSLSNSSLSFGNQAAGYSSAAQTVTLTNTGNAAMTLSGMSFAGAQAASFHSTTTCSATLAVNATCTASVTFAPATAAAASATLNFTDNASGSPQSVAVSGTGVPAITFTQVSSTQWKVGNGIVAFTMDPQNSYITALTVTLNGTSTNWLNASLGLSPMGHAVMLYPLYSYDNPSSVTGTNVGSYSMSPDHDYIDIWVNKPNIPGSDPLAVENHWVLRVADQGMHFYQVLRHTASDAATNFGAATVNFFPSSNAVLQADGSTFLYERNTGPNNMVPIYATFPSDASTASLLAAAPGRQVQAETVDYTDVGGLGTYVSLPGLAREFITKYNYATYEQFHVAHGYVGASTAFWWVIPSTETMNGGPTKQHLTGIQAEYQSAHLGGSNTTFSAGEVANKLFGPFYLYFNAFNATNTTSDELYTDAASQTGSALTFYDNETTLNSNGYTPRPGRGTLQATIASTDWSSTSTNNVVVLSDNLTDMQSSANGFQYWGYADSNGNVTIPNVEPGTYRLSSYILGQWGTFHQDNVTIGTSAKSLAGLTFQPRNFSSQPPVWTIGIPDRSAHEFWRGHLSNGVDNKDYDASRNYWLDLQPNNGKVVYTVGTSDIATSWPFIQYGSFYPNLYAGIYDSADTSDDGYNYITPSYVVNGAPAEGKTAATFNGPSWEIHFKTTAAQTAQGGYVLVSINVAGEDHSSLQVRLNGKHKGALLWYPLLGTDPEQRSGVAGANDYVVFQFNTADLNATGQDNVITLYASGSMLYDALKLEIGPNPANPAITGWPEYDWMYYNSSDSSTQQSAAAP